MTIGNSIADFKINPYHECEDCKGKGIILDTSEKNYGNRIPCERCSGKGYYEKWS